MRTVVLLALAACGSSHPVVRWNSTGIGVNERIEIKSSGDGSYLSTNNGLREREERVVLSEAQVQELDELFRSHGACQLKHDPAYQPAPDEGKATLELSFPDQTCKIELWNLEWARGPAQSIAETMKSMRPLRPPPPGRVMQ